MARIDPEQEEKIANARVARLATVDEDSQPYLVPVVFVLFDGRIYIPIDEKKKDVKPDRLKRVRNIRKNPKVSMLIDQYSEEWSKLSYIMITGKAAVESPDEEISKTVKRMLREKYPQYDSIGISDTFIIVRPEKLTSWKNK